MARVRCTHRMQRMCGAFCCCKTAVTRCLRFVAAHISPPLLPGSVCGSGFFLRAAAARFMARRGDAQRAARINKARASLLYAAPKPAYRFCCSNASAASTILLPRTAARTALLPCPAYLPYICAARHAASQHIVYP